MYVLFALKEHIINNREITGEKGKIHLLTVLTHKLIVSLFHPMTWFMGCIGLILGSFFNVCIERIPKKTFFKSQRSRCPHCDQLIPWWLNIPVMSYMFLRGRSQCCQKKISIQYPVIEILGALCWIFAYWYDPFISGTSPYWNLNINALIRCLHLGTFASLMLICSVIDIKHRIIPDVISLTMILLSPVWVYVHPELDWKSSLIGAALGVGVLYVIAWVYFLIKREFGMGMGDAKLLGAIGGWLGYQALFPTLFWGSILGSAYGISAMIVSGKMNFKHQIPFGPFLAIGALLHMFLSLRLQELMLIR